MATSREARFIASINRRLPPEIHHESCTSPFRSGTPDQYYEGEEGTCRIEYKYIHREKLPKVIVLSNEKKAYGLSLNQNTWLTRAYYNGVKVAVVLGTQKETWMLTSPPTWNDTWTRREPNSYIPDNKGLREFVILSRDDIAKWIIENVA